MFSIISIMNKFNNLPNKGNQKFFFRINKIKKLHKKKIKILLE